MTSEAPNVTSREGKRSVSFGSVPPEAWGPLLKLARFASRPLERFLQIQAASGLLLMLAAAAALAWANSPWADSYAHFWHTPVGIRVGEFSFERSLEWVVNDGLMVIFFFVVGLEIRREVAHGELSEWRRAALPAAAAAGGMLAPAGIYLVIAGKAPTHDGWGVPMATDIAFAVGILVLLGKRVPAALRVLLLALAVIDDLGAILVIALFYSSGVEASGFAIAGAGLLAVLTLQRLGVRSKVAYIPPAVVAWAGIYMANVHPTIAGVVVGLITPVRAWLGTHGFLEGVRGELEFLAKRRDSLDPSELAGALRQIDAARREAMSPAESLIEVLHPWVAYGIMPIFALANAGVALGGVEFHRDATIVIAGVSAGLVLGKPVGVLVASFVTLKLGIGTLPAGVTYRHLVVLGMVAGVGFTMALFVAQLAFADAELLAAAKLGVLAASGAAGVLALLFGALLLRSRGATGAALTADEAESSTEV